MEITVNITLNKQELWAILESLPDNPSGVYSELYERLSAARVAFEGPLKVYGNGAKIKPVEAVHDYHNKGVRR